MHSFAVVPIAALDLAALHALAYAVSLGQPVLAVHVSPTEAEAERFTHSWQAWGDHLPLEVVVSPYRATVAPLANYIAALHRQRPDVTLTLVVPEIVVAKRWQRILHNRVRWPSLLPLSPERYRFPAPSWLPLFRVKPFAGVQLVAHRASAAAAQLAAA